MCGRYPRRGRKFLLLLLGLCFWLLQATNSPGVSVLLEWDGLPTSSLSSWVVYYGSQSRTYTNSLAVGLTNSAVIHGLQTGTTYYFAATAKGIDGSETEFSNEVVYETAPNRSPTIDPVPDFSLPAGVLSQIVNLTGISAGALENQPLAVQVVSSDPLLVQPQLTYSSPNSSGTLTLTAIAGRSGTAQITVTVTDGQPANAVTSISFKVYVQSVNQPPTLAPLADLKMFEDAAPLTVPLSGITAGGTTETDVLQVSASSSDPALIPAPVVTYRSPESSGTLRLSPAPNAYGSAHITVYVSDGLSQIAQSFTVIVSPVNDPPTLSSIAGVTIPENAGLQTINLAGISSGALNEGDILVLSATSSHPALFPHPNVIYTSPNSTAALQFQPIPYAYGTSVVTVVVNDGRQTNNTITRQFPVVITPVNQAPTLSPLPDLALAADAPEQTIPLTGITSGATNENDVLSITAKSSNPGLIPDPLVSYLSPATNGSLRLKPKAFGSGTAQITVTVRDGQIDNGLTTVSFNVSVATTNRPPTLAPIADVELLEDAAPVTVNLTGISPGGTNETEVLQIRSTSSNPALITNPLVTYESHASTGTLRLTPSANTFGSAFITVFVSDAANEISKTFRVNVSAVNDLPTLDPIASITFPENSGPQFVNLSGISSGAPNENQLLVLSASSSNPALLPHPLVSYPGSGATAILELEAQSYAHGTSVVTVVVNDGGQTNNTVTRQFPVVITPVNQAPTLSPLPDLALAADAPEQTIPLTGITSGATNENDVLSITAKSSNPGLIPDPLVSYLSPATNGSLRLKPKAFGSGTAQITVTVSDGQAENGSSQRTFYVHVDAVTYPPTLADLPDLEIPEDGNLPLVWLSGITSSSTNQGGTLTVTAYSDNPQLIPNPVVVYTSPNQTGFLVLNLIPNSFGTALITVTVKDAFAQTSRNFAVNVTPVNDPPTLNPVASISIPENSEPGKVTLSGISSGALNEDQVLTVTATSSDPSLLPHPTVAYVSPGNTATLQLQPVPFAYGTATVSVVVNDGAQTNGTVSRQFTVAVTPVNQPPTIHPIADLSLAANVPEKLVTLQGISSGASDENQVLTITAVSSNPNLIPNPQCSYVSPSTTGSLRLAPNPLGSGVAQITVTVSDGNAENGSTSTTFNVTVQGANQPPTLAPIVDVSLNEDASPLTLALSGISAGGTNESETVQIWAVSDNPSLVGNPVITYNSPSVNGSLVLNPQPNAFGTAAVTVYVSDGVNQTTRSFKVTVAPVNDAPTLNPIASITLPEGAGPQTVGLSGISSGASNEIQTIIITATSSNPALLPNPTVSYVSSSSATLHFQPVPYAYGTAVVSVLVNDGGSVNNTFARQFTVVIAPVNQAPTLDPIANLSLPAGTAEKVVLLTGISSGFTNEIQDLAVTAVSENPSVIPHPTVSYSTPDTTGTLTLSPSSNASGSALIRVFVSDGAGTNSTMVRTFTVSMETRKLARVTLSHRGSGKIHPQATTPTYYVGETYTFAASPEPGSVFTGWTGSVQSSSPSISVTLTEEFELVANFQEAPYAANPGLFTGLIYEENEARVESSGDFKVSVSSRGTYSGRLRLAGKSYAFSGRLDPAGHGTNILRAASPLHVQFSLGNSLLPDEVQGTVGTGAWSARLVGDRHVFNSRTNPCPAAGAYTLAVPGAPESAAAPKGYGPGYLRVGVDGRILFSGMLPDKTRITQSAYLSRHSEWPLYVPTYLGRGMLIAWAKFSDLPDSDVAGEFHCVRPNIPGARLFSPGFSYQANLLGSRYAKPSAAAPYVLGTSTLPIVFSGEEFTDPVAAGIHFSTGTRAAASTPRVSLSLVSATGLFTGSLIHPETGRPQSFHGVVLQKVGLGLGIVSGSSSVGTLQMGAE